MSGGKCLLARKVSLIQLQFTHAVVDLADLTLLDPGNRGPTLIDLGQKVPEATWESRIGGLDPRTVLHPESDRIDQCISPLHPFNIEDAVRIIDGLDIPCIEVDIRYSEIVPVAHKKLLLHPHSWIGIAELLRTQVPRIDRLLLRDHPHHI
ncbi:MAG: hypothetical protein BWY82_02949 [Verrucomicrobia bacterium ADurb.Bin474]|nr:MAG: hypothetical protein BWY82_02949 [Verrucomicrobia bacterium ADurb.Bin474]